MLVMATELRELRGLPKAIQKQFEEQQEKGEGKDKGKPKPLLSNTDYVAVEGRNYQPPKGPQHPFA